MKRTSNIVMLTSMLLVMNVIVWGQGSGPYCTGICVHPYVEDAQPPVNCPVVNFWPAGGPNQPACGGNCSSVQRAVDGGCVLYNQEPTAASCSNTPAMLWTNNIPNGTCLLVDEGPPEINHCQCPNWMAGARVPNNVTECSETPCLSY